MSPCEQLVKPVTAHDEQDFIRAYKEAFGGKPYFESHSVNEVADILHLHLTDGVVIVDREGGLLAGFGCAVPLQSAPGEVREYMQEQIASGSLPTDFNSNEAWYMSELGVVEDFRGKGLAYKLVQHRLAAIADQGGKYYFMRTAAEESNSRHLYEEIGAQRMTAEQDVSESEEVVSSQSQSTRRIFLYGECKQALQLITEKLST